MRASLPFVLASCVALAVPVRAEPYTLDKEHAHLVFAVDHLGFSLVRGRFTEFDAEIDFDQENPENSSIALTIESDSVMTWSRARDVAVKGKSMLNVEAHPEITFVSKSVEVTGDNEAEVTGDLTIRGVTREETFTATLRRAAVSELTQVQTVGFAVEGEIDRRDYEMGFGVPAIGAMVQFNFDVEAVADE